MIFVATKNSRDSKKIFPLLFWCCCRIRDPGCLKIRSKIRDIRNTDCKGYVPGRTTCGRRQSWAWPGSQWMWNTTPVVKYQNNRNQSDIFPVIGIWKKMFVGVSKLTRILIFLSNHLKGFPKAKISQHSMVFKGTVAWDRFRQYCQKLTDAGLNIFRRLYSFILKIKLYDLKTEVNQNKVKLRIKWTIN